MNPISDIKYSFNFKSTLKKRKLFRNLKICSGLNTYRLPIVSEILNFYNKYARGYDIYTQQHMVMLLILLLLT